MCPCSKCDCQVEFEKYLSQLSTTILLLYIYFVFLYLACVSYRQPCVLSIHLRSYVLYAFMSFQIGKYDSCNFVRIWQYVSCIRGRMREILKGYCELSFSKRFGPLEDLYFQYTYYSAFRPCYFIIFKYSSTTSSIFTNLESPLQILSHLGCLETCQDLDDHYVKLVACLNDVFM